VVFPQTPLSFTVEMFYDGAWQNITSDVRYGDKITITRGRRAESGQPEPGSCRLTLRNRDARYTPGNPISPLYGKIGRNTLLRVSVNGTGRFVGEVSTWPPQWTEGGQDAWVSIEASGILRRIDQRKSPLQSTLRRRVTSDPSVLGYWPMEEDAGATSAYSPLPGVAPMRVSGFTFASDDTLAGSAPLPALASTASMQAIVPATTSTGQWTTTCLFDADAGPSISTTLLQITTSGTAARTYLAQTFPGNVRLTAVDSDGGATILFNFTPTQFYGGWVRMDITASESSGSTTIHFGWRNLTTNQGFGADYLLAGTSGAVTGVTSTFGPDAAGMRVGHLGVFSSASTTIYSNAERGFPGEAAHTRFARLCAEEGVSSVLLGSGGAAMGPQPRGRLLDLLDECADADGGMIYESRIEARLNYRTRTALYNQAPKLVLDYKQHLVPGLQPVTDDQTIVNDITVSRTNGSSARAVQSTGTLSIQDAPAGVGKYDQASTINVFTDDQLPDIASWAVHLGTVDEPRYPSIPINLARNYALADAASALTVGDRITVTNTPAWLPPDGIDVILQGATETIASTEWTMTFIGSPASPWTVATTDTSLPSTATSWTDTDGAVLGAAMTSTQTTALVHTTTGQVWSAAAKDTPVNVRIGGELVRLDGPGSTLNSNAYFDTSVTGWTGQGAGASWSTAFVHPLGKGSLFIVPDGVTASGGATCALTPVGSIVPGVPYTVSGWFYSPGGWSDLQPCVDWANAAGSYLSTGFAGVGFAVPAGQWTFLQQTFTAPANASRASMRARHGGTPSVAQTWFAWGVSITQTSASTGRDTFTRTVSGGWGTADSGQAWTLPGGSASERSADGSRGIVTIPNATVSNVRFQHLVPALGDCEVRVRVSAAQVSTGASMVPGVLLRYVDGSNYYRARVHFATGGEVYVSITRDTTQLGANPQLPYSYAPGDTFEMRVRVDGHRIRMRVWPTAAVEPAVWAFEQTVSSGTIAAGAVGVTASGFVGNTNVNPQLLFDNFEIVTPQTCTVTRSVNGVVKAQAAGADVRLATPAIVAL
jgi:hypothetical protein